MKRALRGSKDQGQPPTAFHVESVLWTETILSWLPSHYATGSLTEILRIKHKPTEILLIICVCREKKRNRKRVTAVMDGTSVRMVGT